VETGRNRAAWTQTAGARKRAGIVEYGLEVVVLPVSDADDAARADLAARGAEVSEVFHDATGVFHHAGTVARVAGPLPGHKSYGSFVSFEDPDGNGWLVQEITTRLPGR
jgi:hypothetical protein